MAKPACTFCGQNDGALMVTNLDDGDTQVVCGQDLPVFALGMAGALTAGLDPADAEQYGEAFDTIAANDTRPKQARRSGKRSAPTTAPPPDQVTLDPPIPAGDIPTVTVACPQCETVHEWPGDQDIMCPNCGAVVSAQPVAG